MDRAPNPPEGVYKVCGKLWNVGTRYKVHEHIGSGSYGDVCRATDCQTSLIVALKRVGDVLGCPLLAKRVLREVCIMRRLSHPYVITLTDVFITSSLDTSGGIDLYIATEFANRGDMYHLRDPLSPEDVKALMWQLLSGMNYIHSCRVWHRDVKSENILLTADMSVKICDFGLSRSAEESISTDLHTGIASGLNGGKSLTRQYTKMVVTPSYRAPEVMMSRGQYSSAIDIWSLGCIFWELLMRSKSPNFVGPLLRPLFGVREEPVTPGQGQTYTGDGQSPLHSQIDVIFDVIGTPGWSDIESVPSESWRSYLKHLPGRAGNLTRHLCGCDDQEALDLLLRMLAFNPSRRCTAEEALSHSYFKGLEKPTGAFETPGELWMIKDALEILEREVETSAYEKDGGRHKLQSLLQLEVERQRHQEQFRRSVLTNMQYLRQKVILASMLPPPAAPCPQYPNTRRQTSSKVHLLPANFLEPLVPGARLVLPPAARMTRSATAAAAAAATATATATAAAAAAAVTSVENSSQPRPTRNKAPRELRTRGEEPREATEQVPPRRSPRLRDLQAGDLPHRKRLCLKAG